MRNILLATAAVGVLALAAPAAHATPTLVINASDGTVANVVDVSGNSSSGTKTLSSGVFVDLGAISNAPGSTTAQLFSSTIEITNTTGSTQTVTLAFLQSGYDSPVVPPNAILENGLSGTWSNNVGTSTITAVGCTDATNSAGTSQISCPGGSTSTAGLLGTVSGGSGAFGTGDTDSVLVTSPLSLYSMDEILTITLASGANFNLTDSESLAPVPEPASLALLGVGLLGVGVARRKRSV